MRRVIVFIDGSNLYHGCKDADLRAPWDLPALGRALVGQERTLLKVYYYNARSRQDDVGKEKYGKEEKFYEHLRKMDYCTVRPGRLEGPKGLTHQKGVDVLLVQDLLTLAFASAFDVAILVTNDGDYASVIEEVKSMGKQVEVAFLGDKPAFHLRSVCDRYGDMLREHPDIFRRPRCPRVAGATCLCRLVKRARGVRCTFQPSFRRQS